MFSVIWVSELMQNLSRCADQMHKELGMETTVGRSGSDFKHDVSVGSDTGCRCAHVLTTVAPPESGISGLF